MSTPARLTAMLHVPDVQATAAWYASIGFKLQATHVEPGCPMNWASLAFGASELMLSAGGRPATAHRREVDLYLHVDDLEARFAAIAGKAEIVESLHATEYGMREFIIKDCNGFWITFGQPIEKP